MESYFFQYVSNNESSVRGGGGDNNSSLCTGVTLSAAPPSAAAPTTLFQCWDCFCLFTSEAALIQHQLQMCNFAAKSMGFLERLRQAQQQARIPTSLSKRPYYDSHHQFEAVSSPYYSHSVFLDTLKGSGTNVDPFDDGNMNLDLVSRMDRDFVGTNFGYAAGNGNGNGRARASNGDQQELDLELKL